MPHWTRRGVGPPATGWYTVIVANVASEETPPYDFSLLATGIRNVPEPASIVLLCAALLSLHLLRVRRR